MPAKYSHVKKRSVSGLRKKSNGSDQSKDGHRHDKLHRSTNPHVNRSITQAMSAVSQLERAIARILLIRYEQDIARLFSTRLYSIALVHLPTFMMRCVTVCGPSWPAYNSDCEEIKDFFRAAISMDMRQAGERVATKSVLWSYTALRHFAMSNNVPICPKRGLHSLRLLPYFPALKAHLDVLESMPPASFSKPPHLGTLLEGQEALQGACEQKYGRLNDRSNVPHEWDRDWREKIRIGYEKVTQTLWRVASEFDVRGYGMVLREKLTTKWCDCGCSTDHLGEVCEKTVRDDEEESGVRSGKQREWDGRGSGVYGWETEEEEDIWEMELDFGGLEPDECEEGLDADMTIGELMEWRYLKAEREKEEGNVAFRKGDYGAAVKHYESAHLTEPELPHYQLNLAAAHLKLCNWMEAEKACTKALGQHRSSKGYFRRARARKMQGRSEEAIKDLRAVLKLQPTNSEAMSELSSLLPPDPGPNSAEDLIASSSSKPKPTVPSMSLSEYERLRVPKPKPPKQLPFPRTKADDRKLKIILVPVPCPGPCDQNHNLYHHPHPHPQSHPSPSLSPRGKDNQQSTNDKGKGLEYSRSQAEASAYPSWDRYIVKRVE